MTPADPVARGAASEVVAEETPCPAREDTTHCTHWYDGDACCGCFDPADPSVNEEPEAGDGR